MKQRCCILLFMLMAVLVKSNAQISVGFRNSHFASVQYTFANHTAVAVEQSLFAEKLQCQHIRLYGIYPPLQLTSRINLSGEAYFGTTYNGSYQDMGAVVTANANIFHGNNEKATGRTNIYASVNPHYDTTLKYKTCFAAGFETHLCRSISFVSEYTTIPEYRQSEQRLRCGFRFFIMSQNYGSLSVQPLVSIPLEELPQNSRFHVNFTYTF